MTSRDWAGLIANADAGVVLPHRPRGAAVAVVGPLQLLASWSLGDDAALAAVADGEGLRWCTPLVVDAGSVRRAVTSDGVIERLVGAAVGGDAPDGFSVRAFGGRPVSGERAIEVDQTNDSTIVGEAAVVKLIVRLPAFGEVGSPAGHRIVDLADNGFTSMPAPWAIVSWFDGERDITVATIAEFLPGAEDGWDWAVRDVGAYATGSVPDAPLWWVHELGRMTAEMHRALASSGVSTATAEQARQWSASAAADLVKAIESIDGDELVRLQARRDDIAAAIAGFADAAGSPVIDIHGDFHVGQILRYGSPPQLAVTDFDGSPVLNASERVAQQPAAVDVVSMLASLDHVGRVVIKRVDGADAERVRVWIALSQHAFLQSYRDGLAELYPVLLDEALFLPLRFQQELREYIYAAAHLPHWKYVPDMALQDLLPDGA